MLDALHSQYLEAMGIEAYVARRPLPGAAPSRPLPVIVREPELAPPALERPPAQVAAAPIKVEFEQAKPAAPPASTAAVSPPRAADEAVRFSLAAISAGAFTWIELLDQRPLAREQVQLVAAMARALCGPCAAPQVAQFDWPTHNNRQLDRGPAAARDALAAFLARYLQERQSRGLILLGEACSEYVESGKLPGIQVASTLSTLEILADPGCKRRVWRDLRTLNPRV